MRFIYTKALNPKIGWELGVSNCTLEYPNATHTCHSQQSNVTERRKGRARCVRMQSWWKKATGTKHTPAHTHALYTHLRQTRWGRNLIVAPAALHGISPAAYHLLCIYFPGCAQCVAFLIIPMQQRKANNEIFQGGRKRPDLKRSVWHQIIPPRKHLRDFVEEVWNILRLNKWPRHSRGLQIFQFLVEYYLLHFFQSAWIRA